MSDTCTWTTDEDGISHTDCGHLYALNSGTPKENDMNYCLYCGKSLVEAVEAEKDREDA